MFSVSYYVHAERYWQFCGEYSELSDARTAARAIRADRHGNQVRIRDAQGHRITVGR